MSEGGIYPWKRQTIRQPANGLPGTCTYTDINRPLPDPPKGKVWVQDESSREWRLVPVATVAAEDAVAVARPETANTTGAGVVCAAVPVQSATAINAGVTSAGERYHEVLPIDTFQGLCLRYKVTPTELRRANRMMGSNLTLAPDYPLILIPANEKNQKLNARSATNEEKIVALIAKVAGITENKLSYSEARAYLDLADWDVEYAVQSVREDFGWSAGKEAQVVGATSLELE